MKLSKRTYRQMKNLENIYGFNIDKGIVHVPLYYSESYELLDIHLSQPGKPVVSDETVDYLQEVISSIPEVFQVEISLHIDDYKDYTHEQLMKALGGIIENTYYYHDEKKRHTNIIAIMFIIIGFISLLVEFMGGRLGWFGYDDSLSKNILETVCDVICWVLLWEGCALLFLTYESEATIFNKNMRRLDRISFCDKHGNELTALDSDRFCKELEKPKKGEVFARGYMLISNTFLLAILLVQTFVSFSGEDIPGFSFAQIVAMYIIGATILILFIISNISLYLDKGWFKNHALKFSIPILAFNIFGIIFWSMYLPESMANFILYCMISVCIAIDIICLLYMNKRNVEI